MHKVCDGVRSTHSLDGGVVLDIKHGQVFSLNLVGSRILELLESGQSESAVAASIKCEFGIAMETAETDVREFLHILTKHELIEEPAEWGADSSIKET